MADFCDFPKEKEPIPAPVVSSFPFRVKTNTNLAYSKQKDALYRKYSVCTATRNIIGKSCAKNISSIYFFAFMNYNG